MKFRSLIFVSIVFGVLQLNIFAQDVATLQRENEELKARVATLEEQNAKLKKELENCLADRAPAGGKADGAVAPARPEKPTPADAEAINATSVIGTWGGFYGGRTYKVSFMEAHAFEIVSPSTGESLAGSYKVDGKIVQGDLGTQKVIYQIVDRQTMRTTWDGMPVQLRRWK